ncbi:MAG: DUF1028 domain-containing protein [Alphaproteobacteria bacterium]|nr:DUF1028 domain-containing protein [Alphaproteobacteria bacterium]
MTFSLIGRCERTGMIGFAGATSELAAGGRFPHAKAQIGAVITQALTNPYLGHLGIKLLETGYAPHKVLDEIVASDTHVEFRQLGVMDRFGRTAARTGKNNLDVAEHIAESNLIALGNRVKAGVVGAIAEGFRAASDEDLEERLMRALEAGRDAGGQMGVGQHISVLKVFDRDDLARVDLRVDWHRVDAIAKLRSHLNRYIPLIPYYAERPLNPTVGYREWLEARGVDHDEWLRG